MNKLDNQQFSHVEWCLSGNMLNSWSARVGIADFQKSIAEKESPEAAKESYEEISQLLDNWEIDQDSENQSEFIQDLVDYLHSNTGWEVEIYPDIPEGQPDILIGDLIAISLRVSPPNSEIDKFFKESEIHSRFWITWMVFVNTPLIKLRELTDRLKESKLEQITVWKFN
jgi:hypothetical protein